MTSSVISAQNVPVHYGIRAPFIEKCMVHLSQTVHNTHILFLKNVFSPLCLVCLPYTGLQYYVHYFLLIVTGNCSVFFLFSLNTRFVDPNTLNLDPDPEFWLNLHPDPQHC